MVEASGHIDVAGASLEFRWVGRAPADGPTIVLLHEGLGCVSTWRDFPERLAARTGWGVFVYARRGYGRSSAYPAPWPLSYMHDEARVVLPALLDAIGLRRGVLFGHSDGASIAAIYAGTKAGASAGANDGTRAGGNAGTKDGHADAGGAGARAYDSPLGASRADVAIDGAGDPRIAGLVLMAPHFFAEPISIASIAAARRAYAGTDLRERLRRHHGANVDDAFSGWCDAWLDPGFAAWDLRPLLPAILRPILAIQGEADEYGTHKQIDALRAGAAGPVTVEMLPGCGHAPFKERPEASLEAVARFVAGLT